MPNKWYEMTALANGATEIYIYDEIGYFGTTAKEFARDLKEINPNGSINLHINSPGGSVTDGIAIYNLLKNHSATVNVIVDGLAASMASVIAMAGDTITIPENALMMIHNPRGGDFGDANGLRKTAEILDKMKAAMTSAYATKTGKDSEEIGALMDDETWMTGSEAFEMGFATQTSEEVLLTASFDISKLDDFKTKKQSFFKPLAGAVDDNLKGGVMPNLEKPAPVAVQKDAVIDLVANGQTAVAAFKASEVIRKSEIATAFGAFSVDHAVLLATCINDDNCTVETARAKLLDAIGKGQKPQSGGFSANLSNAGNGKLVEESMIAAVKARGGIKLDDGELVKDNPFRTMSLVEIARASLTEKGVGVASYGDRMQLVGAAFTHSSSDFGNILFNVANKAMLMGYEEAEETFQTWTRSGTLSDFKSSSRVGLNDIPSLREVRPGAEFKYVTVGDRAESIALATYGELLSLNRQTIINDDIGAFLRMARIMGDAAIRTVGDLVYAILTSNPQMSDGVALFHATHKNLNSSAGGALSVNSLDAARTGMRKQKLDQGKALNIRPEYLIVPAALETTGSKLMADTVLPGGSNGESNPVAGMATVVTEARLDDTSAIQWYLAGGSRYDTIEVAYLDGNSAPFLDQIEGWSVDGTAFKVRIDAGVAPIDHRPLFKSNGAA
jgi:ATP-dependent Clp endopeptidase proteolytic subunit ClpP